MVSVLARGLAGGLAGLGQGIVDEARAAREDALMAMRRQWQVQDRAESRQWQLDDRNQSRAWDKADKAEAQAGKDARAKDFANVFASLSSSESGGNTGADNGLGYVGEFQFGQDRLNDFSRAHGLGQISLEKFKSDENLQANANKWHFDDIRQNIQKSGLDKFYGKKINGATITESSIIAMAHLGGFGGAKKFLETGGKYNPADKFGTSLSDYAKKHSGLSTEWGEAKGAALEMIGHEDTSSAQAGLLTALLKSQGVFGKQSEPLTGEIWKTENGQETLYGKNKAGQVVPYTDDKGKPFTRNSIKKPTKITATGVRMIEDELSNAFGEADQSLVRAFAVKVEDLMQEDKSMTEVEAIAHAFEIAEREKVEGSESWMPFGIGDTPPSEGGYTGAFNGAAPQQAEPQQQPSQEGDVLQKAREAIAKGAPQDKVIERLKGMGIDPSKL